MSLSRKAMLACILGSIALRANPAFADSPVVHNATDSQTQEQTEAKRKGLMSDATAALAETQRALKLLDGSKTKDALAALERASGKLDIILAHDPALTLAPAGVSVTTVDLQGGIAVVKQMRQQAQDLISQGRLQEARRLLQNLASETVVTVANIPLATYPAAIKAAVKSIDENKIDVAKGILQSALNTQVLTETTIALPVVYARESLKEAETLAQKKDRTQDDNAHLKASLDGARVQLELAQALGYGTSKDFDTLYQELKDVEAKTADNKSGTGFFAKLKASVAALTASIAGSSQH